MDFDGLLSKISESKQVGINGLEGNSFAYFVSQLWFKQNKPLLIVCKDASSANALYDDISFFLSSVDSEAVSIFPGPTAATYSHMLSQSDVWIDRLKTLYRIETEDAPLIITSIDALSRKVPPRELFYKHIELVSVDQNLDRDEFLEKLVACGYSNSPLVEDQGDFAVRGYLIDIWSPVSDRPVRIELDGDLVVSIRSFDPSTQRTSFSVNSIPIIPVRSVIIDQDIVKKGLVNLKKKADALDVSAVERREYADSVKSGIYPAHTETLLPIFHPDSVYLWDYLDDNSTIIVKDPKEVDDSYSKFRNELETNYNEAKHIEKAVVPDSLYLKNGEWGDVLDSKNHILVNHLELLSKNKITSMTVDAVSSVSPVGRWVDGSSEKSLEVFVKSINEWQAGSQHVVIVCHSEIQADRVVDLLRWQGLTPKQMEGSFNDLKENLTPQLLITIGDLSEGFNWPDEKLVLLTEKEIFGKRRRRVSPIHALPTEAFTSYQELSDGDLIVHILHGVGRYRGMNQMTFGEMTNDFLLVEYLGGDKLYIPAYRLNQIQKYVGAGEGSPMLDKLGGTRWQKAKVKANRAVRRMASELLKLYAMRKVKKGFAFSGRDHLMEEFEGAFPYDETPDQMLAIDDVLKDMQEEFPSDRLICGDVGYGKTEVAMRGAYKAVMDGKQVALLVPTTVLAFQHFETLVERFKGSPINIEYLNRFKTGKEQAKVLEDLKAGRLDIVVGTHRLIQKDIKFKDLGLLIIDEEHRFGVKQKEAIKQFRATVDVISMSATPIPRSLHISLVGARDISVINTPPADRRSIRTYVAEFDEGLIRGAILKEINRGGQVFFVHNRVQTIESMKDRLAKLVPEAKIRVGHGQMKEHELEKVMVGFLKKDFNVFLTTTIIESGLDIPSANTMIINRADTFGLAQLYQLRGRVGRSSLQAYAYLLIPDETSITPLATKRLAALQKYTELGSGFQIAMHDLEIRGSGNILGAEQSGHISAIGYELYTELLEKEIRKLKGEGEETEIDTEIQLPLEAYIPADYIEDNGTRIVTYKRISSVGHDEEIEDLNRELRDRFGDLPEPVSNLFKIMAVKIIASQLGIETIQVSKGVFVYKFADSTSIPVSKMLDYVKKSQDRVTLKPSSTLVVSEDVASKNDIFRFARKHLEDFQKLSI